MVRSMLVKTNDMHMAMYLSALIRSVIALNDLINNRIQFGEHGIELEKGEEKKEEVADSKVSAEKKVKKEEKK
jgi:26S proteasome regulatory subunit N8